MKRAPSVRQKIMALYRTYKSKRGNAGGWRGVAAHIEKKSGIKLSAGYLRRVGLGEQRPSNKVLIALGLPPQRVEVEACQRCGEGRARCACQAPKRPARPKPARTLYDIPRRELARLIRERVEIR